MNEKWIMAINPGSTSTKLAVFCGDRAVVRKELFLDSEMLKSFDKVIDQLPMRTQQVQEFLNESGIAPAQLDMIVARGGPIPTAPHNCYYVNQLLLDTMRYAPAAQHASALACMIGWEIARPYQIPVIIYDSTGTDEYDPISKITGLPEIRIRPVSHILNTRMVAREAADQMGIRYEEGRFVVAHLGGGFSINAHRDGRVIDAIFDDMGPVSPQRVGRIPNRYINQLSAKYTPEQLSQFFSGGKGGLVAWFQTQDIREVERMKAEGDEDATLVYDAMTCGVAKAIGEMTAVLAGKVDALILTGGVARSEQFVQAVLERVSFVPGKRFVMPGEKEMEALNRGGQRVLAGEEQAYDYDLVPEAYQSREDFDAYVAKQKKEAKNKC